MSKIRDPRLPAAGTVITRKFKDADVSVTVNETDFVYNGKTYTSLSKIAAEAAGQKAVNGFAFFHLGEASVKKPRKAKDATPAAAVAAPEATPAPVTPAAAPEATPAADASAPVSLGDLA